MATLRKPIPAPTTSSSSFLSGLPGLGNLPSPLSTGGLPGAQPLPRVGGYGSLPAVGGQTPGVGQEGLNPIPQADNFGPLVQQRQNAAFQRGMNMLRPDMDRQRSGLEATLANRGIGIGSEAYDDAVGQLDQSQNRALENLALSSVGLGFDEHSRLSDLALRGRGQEFGERLGIHDAGLRGDSQRYGQELGRYSAGLQGRNQLFGERLAQQTSGLARRQAELAARQNAFNERRGTFDMSQRLRQQALQERQLERQSPWNELAAVLNMTPINRPNFANPAQYSAQAPDIMGYTAAQQQARAQQAAGPWGFLGNVLGAALGGGFF